MRTLVPPSRPFPPSLFQTQPHGVLWLMGPPRFRGCTRAAKELPRRRGGTQTYLQQCFRNGPPLRRESARCVHKGTHGLLINAHEPLLTFSTQEPINNVLAPLLGRPRYYYGRVWIYMYIYLHMNVCVSVCVYTAPPKLPSAPAAGGRTQKGSYSNSASLSNNKPPSS